MEVGIVGLPNVGKSTLFNAITKAGAESANYPFCTIEPNIGIANVPDSRLDDLVKIYTPKKTTPAIVKFIDIAGIVKGASQGEGLGNKFLSNIRNVDAIIHVVRCFEDENIIHVDSGVNPIQDIETINTELILSDLELIQNRLTKVKKSQKFNKDAKLETELLEKIIETLNKNEFVSFNDFNNEEIETLKSFNMITAKPIMYLSNISEEDYKIANFGKYAELVEKFARKNNAEFMAMSAKIEEEINSFNEEDKKIFLEDLNIKESAFNEFVRKSYHLLELISYFTAGSPEVRAWTIKKGTKAPGAAGKIHSDFERGFIRAEVINYKDLIKIGNIFDAREKGLLRSEGKEYIVKDGDVIHFLFNV